MGAVYYSVKNLWVHAPTAPILTQAMAMPTRVPAFYAHNNSCLGRVDAAEQK